MLHMREMCETAVRNEEALRHALAGADVVPALLVLAYITDDMELVQQAAPHIQGAWNYQETIPDFLRIQVREKLVRVLKEYAQGDRLLPQISHDRIRELMSACVGSYVAPEYVPMMFEELGLGASDTRSLQWENGIDDAQKSACMTVIIGAGIAGICAGVRLKEAGVPFIILERNQGVGGTWFENTYPGCGVDTPNHFYSFSFNHNADWTRYFCAQKEIRRYLEDTVEKFGIGAHVAFGCSVTEACWDEAGSSWTISYDSPEGPTTVVANVMLTAVGHNVPSKPDIPGLDRFAGECLHTAYWNDQIEMSGKRVAMIGTGASGMQAGPAVAPIVEHLAIFQRTPHWVMGNPNYHKPVAEGQQWALQHIPFFAQWHRFLLFWATSDGAFSALQVDPEWPMPALSLNKENHKLRETISAYIRNELDGDEDLIGKCIPQYPPYGKRLLRDNHWYKMLKRENVSLVTQSIKEVTERGIVTDDGSLHEADVIIMATGFQASKLLWPMEIVGKNGVTIRSIWGEDDPRAYKGMAVPGFPNMFVLAGPNTTLSHGGSAVFQLECQVRYVTQALKAMTERGLKSVEVRQDTYERYNTLVDERHSKMVWAHPGVHSWYKNKKNRVTMTSPWRLVDFWQLTRDFDSSEYVCVGETGRPFEQNAGDKSASPPNIAERVA